MSSIFEVYDDRDPQWVAKSYFDRIYELGIFVKVIGHLSCGNGYGVDGAYCAFPDPDSFYEEDRFDGVRFIYGDGEGAEILFLSEGEFVSLMQEACKFYVESGGEGGDEVIRLLSKSPLC
ncbi:ribonuclease toxin immunity protein CdiI [Stenotrophomonas sp. TD3]|uniref:ribonuclease toxin immunity protein CdiI n=1 Tax=Stenotrophomonas sp. TD3 TaxID=1641707 RepID=UPI000950CA73|nr:ribonuclease toxin immunity protein CdiI [Stenotrophomonas sp. TD3]